MKTRADHLTYYCSFGVHKRNVRFVFGVPLLFPAISMSIFQRLLLFMVCGAGVVYLFPKVPNAALVTSNKVMLEAVQNLEEEDIRRPAIAVKHWTDRLENVPMFGPNVLGSPDSDFCHSLNPMFQMGHTSLYTLQRDTSVLLLYRQMCPTEARPDPTLVDYWFLDYLQPAEVAPAVFGISRRLNGETIKNQFPATKGKLHAIERCPDGQLAHVRYTVMERAAGDSIFDVLTQQGALSMRLAMDWAIAAIHAIERMHALNVIHGDIHTANIMVAEYPRTEVKLIDFERAHIYNAEEHLEVTRSSCGGTIDNAEDLFINRWVTVWESQGCPKSFRDDVFQLLFVIGAMIHGPAYTEFQICISDLLAVNTNVRGDLRNIWVQHRTQADKVFDIYPIANPNLPAACNETFDVPKSIRADLTRFAALILDLRIDDRPPYRAIRDLLRQIGRHSEGNHMIGTCIEYQQVES